MVLFVRRELEHMPLRRWALGRFGMQGLVAVGGSVEPGRGLFEGGGSRMFNSKLLH